MIELSTITLPERSQNRCRDPSNISAKPCIGKKVTGVYVLPKVKKRQSNVWVI